MPTLREIGNFRSDFPSNDLNEAPIQILILIRKSNQPNPKPIVIRVPKTLEVGQHHYMETGKF